MSGPWRDPGEETVGLYPGLVVCDDRVTGSITIGRSRLPVWSTYVSFPEYEEEYGVTAADLGDFVHHLLEMRGEFGRLLLMLADAERRDLVAGKPWWDKARDRKRVAAQLRRCLAVLENS